MQTTPRRNIQIPSSDRSDRPDPAIHIGYVGNAADTSCLYAQGTNAARLAFAHTLNGGLFWYETDTGSVFYDDGTNWHGPIGTPLPASITNAMLAANSVDSSKIADGSIVAIDLAANSVTPPKIGTNLTAINMAGTHAARPAATTVLAGTTYFETDTNTLFRSDGSVWTTIAAPSSGGSNLVYHGDYVAGTYNDGDLVVYNGILYMCTQNGVSAAPSAWPPPGAQDAIPKSVVTAGGDVIVATAPGVVTNVPVGTLGQILTRIAAAPYVGWQTPASPGPTLLYDSGYIAAPQASFDVSGLPSTYTKLIIECYLRSTAAAVDGLRCRFNGDSTSGNYGGSTLMNTNATAGAQNVDPTSVGTPAILCSAAQAANEMSFVGIDIPFYAAPAFKSIPFRAGFAIGGGGGNAVYGMSRWANIAAINRVTITPLTGPNWAANSRCMIWGVT